MVIAGSDPTEVDKRNERPNESYVKTRVLDLFKWGAKRWIRLNFLKAKLR